MGYFDGIGNLPTIGIVSVIAWCGYNALTLDKQADSVLKWFENEELLNFDSSEYSLDDRAELLLDLRNEVVREEGRDFI